MEQCARKRNRWPWVHEAVWVLLLVALTACGDSTSAPPPANTQTTASASSDGSGDTGAPPPPPPPGAPLPAGAPDPCLDGLPIPTPTPPSKRVVQLVNCTNQTLLGATNAAFKAGQQPTAVLPREKTWVMEPVGAPNFKNVLTIDVPPEWEDTKCHPDQPCPTNPLGPRFWARTGCRYDTNPDASSFGRAQCETGGCGGVYDCSKAHQSASVATTIAEWTFAEPVESGSKKINYLKDSFDISAVDGVNLTMDIQPLGGSDHDPFDVEGGHDLQWINEQYPLSKHGDDMRADNRCIEDNFRLKRSMLTDGKPYGFVMVEEKGGKDVPLGGDATVACFSNCGRYAFPAPPKETCDHSDKTSLCYRWKVLCLGDPSQYYATRKTKCQSDSDCPVLGACWDLKDPSSAQNLTCNGRGFLKNYKPEAPHCDPDVCTYPYGYVDPRKKVTFYSTQPPFGKCSDISSDPSVCLGDDTMHTVYPKGYTWPNDPQVYGGDAPAYRVIFAPGGTNIPITPTGPIPLCKDLPEIYGYASQLTVPDPGPGHYAKPCDNPVYAQGAKWAVAKPHATSTTNTWACLLPTSDSDFGSGNEGVICRWNAANPAP